MPEDPIVEEIHRIRQQLLKKYGGFDGYVKHLFEEQEKRKDRVVNSPSRQPARKKRRA
jgi:hypothetical protein